MSVGFGAPDTCLSSRVGYSRRILMPPNGELGGGESPPRSVASGYATTVIVPADMRLKNGSRRFPFCSFNKLLPVKVLYFFANSMNTSRRDTEHCTSRSQGSTLKEQ